MSDLVNCDICGKLFNPRYVASHKRMAHAGKAAAANRKKVDSAEQAMRKIVAMCRKLSAENRLRLIAQLQELAK